MNNAYFHFPMPENEPVKDYAPGSPERLALKEELTALKNRNTNIPMVINGEDVFTEERVNIHPPHELSHTLGQYSKGTDSHVKQAIDAALQARQAWAATSWEHRASVFLKAAELMTTKYRALSNAATMLGQSKNVFQSEIDGVCELADFLRFNVHFLSEIYNQQPNSSKGVNNRMEYRPLEGFVAAVTPFNFTAIGGNLPLAPAMCGNVALWKPSDTQIYSAHFVMEILKEAGLPDGVVNLLFTDGPVFGDTCLNHPDFAGLHFTGSTATFKHLWKQIGNNIDIYKSYPRIVGETGGKDFVAVHKSANVDEVVTGLARGAYEFQGQKCSAASRAYLPSNIADEVKEKLIAEMKSMKMGSVEDFGNFINAVIDERAFDKISGYIKKVKESDEATILVGGNADKETGYFVEPTLVEADKPDFLTMKEEIFGPVLTLYVYDENQWEETLDLVDNTTDYALTGAIFSKDRQVIEKAAKRLENSAGNFYINDKPTGAVVGQQPFGGARASGTNDKAGSILNLYRWLNARTIKETFVPATDYRYPFLGEE
ncbi:MAG TPA: L-glutamate gamma-semialdehyde dehydrogenase [Chitinophagaceae bacterium]|nr:L-glutamate gamma-semialdehyde dehydrogenase [Chitinophagaceae bacterium]